jgi:hypothetical protein
LLYENKLKISEKIKMSFTLAPERLPCGRSLQAEDRILPEEHFELAFCKIKVLIRIRKCIMKIKRLNTVFKLHPGN